MENTQYFVSRVYDTLPRNSKTQILSEWAKAYEHTIMSADSLHTFVDFSREKVEALNRIHTRTKALHVSFMESGVLKDTASLSILPENADRGLHISFVKVKPHKEK